MKNILILGGSGFIGKNIIENLPFDMYNIINYSRNIIDIQGIKNIKGSLFNEELLLDIIIENNIDIVVHLVSSLHTTSTHSDFQKELSDVIQPTFKLIDFAVDKKVQFIFFSSGGTIYDTKDATPKKEEDILKPVSYYGYSKKMIEDYILFKEQFGLNYLILRPSNPYGKYQNIFGNQGIIGIFLKKVLLNETIQIFGDGENTRDYIEIEDLCSIFNKIIENGINNKTLNIGSGKSESINKILKHIEAITKKQVSIGYKSSRQTDVKNITLDVNLLLSLLNGCEFTDLENGIKKMYSRLKEDSRLVDKNKQ